jgi:hypothetical protein
VWIVWGALVAVGLFFACGIIVALYFDIRGWLRPHHTVPSAAAPEVDSQDAALPSEPLAESREPMPLGTTP